MQAGCFCFRGVCKGESAEADLAAADAETGVGVVDDTELSGGDALDAFVAADEVAFSLRVGGDEAALEGVGVADLEPDFVGKVVCLTVGRCVAGRLPGVVGNEMKVFQAELVAVLFFGIVSVGDVDDVFFNVLVDYKPGTAAEAQSFALADGVEPEASVGAEFPPGLQFDDGSGTFSEEAADEIVVVDFSEETDALAVFAAGTGQAGVEGYLTDFFLEVVAQGKEQAGNLQVVDLGEEVGLVLDGVFGGREPGAAVDLGGRGIVAGGNLVVGVTGFFIEAAELDEFVAHHVGVGGEAAAYLIEGIADHALPVFLVEVDDLQFQSVFPGGGSGQFDVFFGGAAQSVVGVHADADIKQIGTMALFAQQVYGYGTVHSSRYQCCYVHLSKIKGYDLISLYSLNK